MATPNANRTTLACLAGAVGVISLLFFPFAGFTERTAYAPSAIYRDYGITGIGTYGQDFNLFGYPAGVGIIQILTLLLAGVLGYAVWRCFRLSRGGSADGTGPIVKLSLAVAGSAVVLVIVTLVAVFPSVEEQTIWVTESDGWLEGWWIAYGAFVSPLAAAAMALLLRESAPPAPPVVPPSGEAPAPPPSE